MATQLIFVAGQLWSILRPQNDEAREIGEENWDTRIHMGLQFFSLSKYLIYANVKDNSFLPLESKTIIIHSYTTVNPISVAFSFYTLHDSIVNLR